MKFVRYIVILLVVMGSLFLFACGSGKVNEPSVRGIESIEKTSTEGLVDTYTITFTNGQTTTFTVTNGKDGVTGAQGIQGIQGIPGKDGHTPVITIENGYWYIDGVDTGKSASGLVGETGNGISSIIKTSTDGLIDTYTITFTNGQTTTFTVTNGKDGATGTQGIQGIQGIPGKDGHTPVITIENGNWHIDGVDTGKSAIGLKGDAGNGISSIKLTNTEGLIDTYTITFTNGQTTTFTVTNGKDGATGAQGIQGIQGIPGKDGHTPVITIENGNWYIDGVDTSKSAIGLKGDPGNGISSIKLTNTEGLVDTYTITFTNGQTTTFTVTNGKDGATGAQGIQGIQGEPGKDGHTPVITIENGNWYIDGVDTCKSASGLVGETGNGIVSIKLTNTEGLIDTYTITFTNGETTTFTVTNGKDGATGAQGIQGIQGIPGKDGHTPVITIENGNWHIDGVNTNVLAEGLKGEAGNGISSIKLTNTEGLIDTYTITFTNGETTTFTVTNGKDGATGAQGIQGIQGEPGKDGHAPVITIENGNWYIDGVDTGKSAIGLKGETGNGISSIKLTNKEGLIDTYTITFTNGQTTTFTVTNGKDGAQGIQGIQGIPGKDGHTPVITIVNGYWHIDGVNTLQPAQGVQGETGNGISSIKLTNTNGLVDTYTIYFTDGTITTFTVTNGKPAAGIGKVEFDDNGNIVITLTDGTVLDPVELPKKEEHIHNFCEWIVIKDPTCTTKGVETRFCLDCNYSESRFVEELGHKYNIDKCTRCNIDMYRLTSLDLVKYQGGINSVDGSIITSFTNNWYSKIKIPEGATEVSFLEYRTFGNYGIAFFNNDTFISGSCNNLVGGNRKTLEIPSNANYLYYGYLYDEIAQENGFQVFDYIDFLGENIVLSTEDEYLDLPKTRVHAFTVRVDTSSIASTKYSYATDYGYIMLPTNYTKNKEATRLVIVCHGAGASIDTYKSDATKSNNYTYLTDLGFAVMDMYACPPSVSKDNSCLHYGNPVVLECYKAGYDYVMKHFNLADDGIFVLGSSMGGLSSFQLVQSGYFPVLAQVGYCPAVDLFKQAYCNPWASATYQRSRIASYFSFNGTTTFTSGKFPSNAEIEFYKSNFENTINYSPITNCITSGNPMDIFNSIPKSAVGFYDEEEAIYNSFIASHNVPLLVFHNLDDATVSYRYSKYIVDMINRGSGNAMLYTFESGGHNAWCNGSDYKITGINGKTITIKETQYQTYLYLLHHLPNNNHKLTDTVIDPTCSSEGYTLHECTNCDYSFIDSYKEITDHSYENGHCKVCNVLHPKLENFEGKVISIMSDSTSTFAGYIPEADGFNLAHRPRYPQDNLFNDVKHTWWMQLITDLDAKLGINESWAGSTISNINDTNTGDIGPDAAMASLTRIKNLGSNGTPDLILFYGGRNDITKNYTIGSFDENNAPSIVDLEATKWDTIIDGFVTAVLRIRYYYPTSELIIMMPHHNNNATANNKTNLLNAEIEKVCKYYGVKYLDLRELTEYKNHLPDGSHPDEEGMDMITNLVERELINQVTFTKHENIVYSVKHTLVNGKAELHYYKGVSNGETFTEAVIGKEVIVLMGGVDITNECYNDGVIYIETVSSDIEITVVDDFDADGHLQILPEKICSNTNLWTILSPENIYYTVDGWGLFANSPDVHSITFNVKPGDKIWATSFGGTSLNNDSANGTRITWFSESGLLATIDRNTVYNEFLNNGYITVPEGAIALNVPAGSKEGHEVYILNKEHIYENNVCIVCEEYGVDFSDMTFTAFGDSITYGADLIIGGRVENPYPAIINEILGLKSYENKGVSGATLTSNNQGLTCMTNVITSYTTKTDIIGVLGGVNDYNRSLPLGDITDKDVSTIYGALHVSMSYLSENYSDSFIFYMTPYKEYFHGVLWSEMNSQGYNLADVANAIKEVAAIYNIPVLDLLNEGNFESIMYDSDCDGIHPNQKFITNVMAPQIAQFIKDNYKKHCEYEEIIDVKTIQYDDHIDISNNDVKIIDADKDNIGNSVVTISGNYLIATNIGTALVRIDEQIFKIVVEKAKLNLVMIMGQSNAGNHFKNATSDIVCPIGTAYWFGNNQGVNAKEPVSYTMPSMGFHTPLLAELYAQSVENENPVKNVMIWHEGITSKNGQSIIKWAKSATDTSGTDDSVTMLKNCLSYYQAHSDKYEIVSSGVYWLQGESDLTMDPLLYTERFMAMWNRLKSAGMEYLAFFRVRRAVSTASPISDDLYYSASLSAQIKMINDNPDFYMATTITENWIGTSSETHTIDISKYITLMDAYSNQTTYNDEYGNYATIEDGKLTTSMKSLYGSNNVCHYGKFGYAIIAADAAYNMYRALNNNDMAIVIADTSGYAKREKIVLNGNTINLDISSMTDNITFRATCGSTAGTLGFVIKSNNADITNNIGVIVESGEKYYSINVQTLRYYENVAIDILYKTTQGKVCKVICRLTGYDVEVQEDYVWQFDADLKARNTDGEVVNSFLENALVGSYTIEDGYLKANKLQLELENNILLSYDKNWSIEWKYGLLNDGFAGFLLCEDKANTIGNKALYHNYKGYFAVSDYYNSDGYRNYTTNDFTIKDNDCIRLTNQYDEATGKSVLSLWVNDELKVVNMQLKGCINGYIDNVDMTQYPLIANFEFEYLGNTGMTNWLVNCELDYLKISFEN